jgi:hypothetical protein
MSRDHRNSAFVFIKPHALILLPLVKTKLAGAGVAIVSEGAIGAAAIDTHKLIDQHYYAIASKATILKPHQLSVPEDKFQAKFGVSFADVLKAGAAYNATDACEYFECDALTLEAAYRKSDNQVKLGGGFYCGLVGGFPGKAPVYVFNAFFMAMRQEFVEPGAGIHYLLVEWDGERLPWAAFRGELLGPTDPATAPVGSIRGGAYANWEVG